MRSVYIDILILKQTGINQVFLPGFKSNHCRGAKFGGTGKPGSDKVNQKYFSGKKMKP